MHVLIPLPLLPLTPTYVCIQSAAVTPLVQCHWYVIMPVGSAHAKTEWMDRCAMCVRYVQCSCLLWKLWLSSTFMHHF